MTVSLAVFTLVVPATSILVDKGTAGAGDRRRAPGGGGGPVRHRPGRLGRAERGPDRHRRPVHRARGRRPPAGRERRRGRRRVGSGHRAGAAARRRPGDRPGRPSRRSSPATSAWPRPPIEQIVRGARRRRGEAGCSCWPASPRRTCRPTSRDPARTPPSCRTPTRRSPPTTWSSSARTARRCQEAQEDNPGQWQTWWWVCIAGQVLFLPFTFVMTGRWSPKKAREDEQAHEEKVQQRAGRPRPVTPIHEGSGPGTRSPARSPPARHEACVTVRKQAGRCGPAHAARGAPPARPLRGGSR